MQSSRYETLLKIATGGMATVYLGRTRGALGFEQLVAIKRPHPHLVQDPAFREMLAAEAQLAARIRHANAVSIRDAELVDDTVLLVMDYIEGGSLADLLLHASTVADRRSVAPMLVRVMLDVCAGLHAAHELRDDDDAPLGLVHRDVSPQNVLVGVDGVSRVTDFGVAKCFQVSGDSTTEGVIKGKLAYMSPEQVQGRQLDRRSDVFATGVVLWEALTGERLFRGAHPGETVTRVLNAPIFPVSHVAPQLGRAFDAVLEQALSRTPERRQASVAELAEKLEATALRAGLLASHGAVARMVEQTLGAVLTARRQQMRALRVGSARMPVRDTIRTDSGPDSRADSSSVARASIASVVSEMQPVASPEPVSPLRSTQPLPTHRARLPAAPADHRALALPTPGSAMAPERQSSMSFTPAGAYRDEAAYPARSPRSRLRLWVAALALPALVVLTALVVARTRRGSVGHDAATASGLTSTSSTNSAIAPSPHATSATKAEEIADAASPSNAPYVETQEAPMGHGRMDVPGTSTSTSSTSTSGIARGASTKSDVSMRSPSKKNRAPSPAASSVTVSAPPPNPYRDGGRSP